MLQFFVVNPDQHLFPFAENLICLYHYFQKALSEMSSSSSSSSRTMEKQESSSSLSSTTSSVSQRVHRQLLSEMSSTSSLSSSELQNSQQLLHHRLADDGILAAADEDSHHRGRVHSAQPTSTAVTDDPLVTFPESPPVLVSNVSPMLNASTARPKPVRIVAATSNAVDEQRHVSKSKLVKEAYESSSSSSSNSTISDSQDTMLQSLHLGGADVRKLHAANVLRNKLADYGASKNALNNFKVRNDPK